MLTPVLTLVPFSAEHFQLLSGWFSTEAEVVQWGGTAVTHPLSAELLNAMLDEARAAPPTRLCWMARNNYDLVGHAQLGFDWRNGTALLSRVAIAPLARGQRLAGPMLQLVIDQAFNFETIERVELNVYDWNTVAIKTYERLGFVLEGTRRSSAAVNGERWNTSMMAVLRDEWKA